MKKKIITKRDFERGEKIIEKARIQRTKNPILNLSGEEEKKANIEIRGNFGQDFEKAKEFEKDITKFLKPLKKKGLLDFKARIFRKCDFCGKELKEGDKFKTIGQKDKCEDCQKKK